MYKSRIISVFLIFQLLSVSAVLAEPEIDAGQSHALFSQAMANLLGLKGQQKSPKLAFQKFEVLAQQGWKTAQHMLGNMYYKGEGTDQDSVKAYLWYSLAAKQDFSIAQEKLVFLRQNLKKEKIQEAELLISDWES